MLGPKTTSETTSVPNTHISIKHKKSDSCLCARSRLPPHSTFILFHYHFIICLVPHTPFFPPISHIAYAHLAHSFLLVRRRRGGGGSREESVAIAPLLVPLPLRSLSLSFPQRHKRKRETKTSQNKNKKQTPPAPPLPILFPCLLNKRPLLLCTYTFEIILQLSQTEFEFPITKKKTERKC